MWPPANSFKNSKNLQSKLKLYITPDMGVIFCVFLLDQRNNLCCLLYEDAFCGGSHAAYLVPAVGNRRHGAYGKRKIPDFLWVPKLQSRQILRHFITDEWLHLHGRRIKHEKGCTHEFKCCSVESSFTLYIWKTLISLFSKTVLVSSLRLRSAIFYVPTNIIKWSFYIW